MDAVSPLALSVNPFIRSAKNRARGRSSAAGVRPAALISALEPLEARQLLSAATSGISALATGSIYIPKTDARFASATDRSRAFTQYQILSPSDDPVATPYGSSGPTGKSPSQIRHAYGVDNILFGSLSGDGTGQTIAIIDAYDNPSFVSDTDSNYSISDLHRFNTQFALPDAPSFKKVNQSGGTTYPAFNSQWAGEIALDVEWAHAIAPKASILLVEANSASTNNLYAAINYAKQQPGVTAVSMSFGFNGEYSTESSLDSYFTTPDGHANVSFFASTGDNGGASGNPYTGYAAYSPNVVSVGGTSLTTSGTIGTYTFESAWSGSGGGVSQYVSKPSYQSFVTTPSSTMRTIPDVSFVANPNTGVSVLDTSSSGIGSSNGWYVYGGTSLSAPMWAGIGAIVNQGRANLGLGSLEGASQLLPRLYSLSSSDFHDITSGSNGGYSASAGYDLVTGRGTPVANQLVPDLAGGVTLSGSIFQDNNGSGALDGSESGIGGVTVFIDTNNNGSLDSGELSTTTSAGGTYTFGDLIGGVTFNVRAVTPSGSYIATGGTSSSFSGSYGASVARSFGFFPTAFGGSAFTLRLDPAGTTQQIFTAATAGTTPDYSIATSVLGSSALSFTGTSGADTFNIDLTNGNSLPAAASFNGNGGADTIVLTGGAEADVVAYSGASLAVGGRTLSFTAAPSVALNLGSGNDVLNVLGGTFAFSADASVTTSNLTVNVSGGATVSSSSNRQQFAALNLNGAGAAASIAPGGSRVLVLGGISIASSAHLDIADNSLIVDTGADSLASVRGYLVSGRNGGAWNGLTGITSVVVSETTGSTVGHAGASQLFGTFPASFAGESVSSTATLVRFTLGGDVNLDRTVNIVDLGVLASNWQGTGKNFAQGDFNYDDKVDIVDLGVLAASWQSSLPASLAAQSAQITQVQSATAAASAAAPSRSSGRSKTDTIASDVLL